MDTQTTLIALILAVSAAALAVTARVYLGTRRRDRLKERFGPEYDHAVAEQGSPRRAEARLEERERRVERLSLRPVPPDLLDRFARSWRNVQARFVDEPGAAVLEADGLVRKMMASRGYPMASFEQREADLSVDHPTVVASYRAAHEVALKRERGEASTEELRRAFLHYRELFDELLEAPELVETGRV